MARLFDSAKSIAKIALQSRRPSILKDRRRRERPLLVMGNGPSLAEMAATQGEAWRGMDKIAVNFAASAPQYAELKPEYYILADPLLFTEGKIESVDAFWTDILRTSWPMTLLVPARQAGAAKRRVASNACISVRTYNPVGVGGWQWLQRLAYDKALGMPRPRNVLIPAIMAGIALGYKQIYLAGADHSWLKNISVNADNQVVSVFEHFYKESDHEARRVEQLATKSRLHEFLQSLAVAFGSYHDIARYAAGAGVEIVNATPGSYIDAFPRAPRLPLPPQSKNRD